jgi:hypothetical protein
MTAEAMERGRRELRERLDEYAQMAARHGLTMEQFYAKNPHHREMLERHEEQARRRGISLEELLGKWALEADEEERLTAAGKQAGAEWASRQTDLRVIRRVAEVDLQGIENGFWWLGAATAGLDLDAVSEALIEKGELGAAEYGAIYDAQFMLLYPDLDFDRLVQEKVAEGKTQGEIIKEFPPLLGVSCNWGPGISWVEGFVEAVQEAWKEIQDRLVESAMKRMPADSSVMKQ